MSHIILYVTFDNKSSLPTSKRLFYSRQPLIINQTSAVAGAMERMYANDNLFNLPGEKRQHLIDAALCKFTRNLLLNMNYKIEYKLIMDVKNPTTRARIREFYRNYIGLIDTSGLNIHSEEKLLHLIKILRAILIQNFIQFFAGEADEQEVLHNFRLELELLKRGLHTSMSNET